MKRQRILGLLAGLVILTASAWLSDQAAASVPDPIQQATKLVAADASSGDEFGLATAVSHNTIVIGAWSEDGGSGDPLSSSGAVYVFGRHQDGKDQWGLIKKLSASDAQSGDEFGYAVAVDGDRIAVGAPQQAGGAVYIFERNQGGPDNWGEVIKISADDGQASDDFGFSLGLSIDTLLVGAPLEDGGAGDPLPNAGAAYIFARNQNGADQWGQVNKLTASDSQTGDDFGWSVAISVDYAVVGADWEAGGSGDPINQAGAAYVFERSALRSSWGEVKKLLAPDAQESDAFGFSVSISAETIVVGAPEEDGGSADPHSEAGAVYIFERDRGGPGNWGYWKQIHSSDAENEDFFGYAVAISGDHLLIGAYAEDGGAGDPNNTSGAAYAFGRDLGGTSNWGEIQKLQAADRDSGEQFGISVAVAGTLFIAGANLANSPAEFTSGAVYIFLSEEFQLFLPISPRP
jgi:hypothetical protein